MDLDTEEGHAFYLESMKSAQKEGIKEPDRMFKVVAPEFRVANPDHVKFCCAGVVGTTIRGTFGSRVATSVTRTVTTTNTGFGAPPETVSPTFERER